jgi:hypothetical protein
MPEYTVYTVRHHELFWAVMKGEEVVAAFVERDLAIAHALGLMEDGCERLEASRIILEGDSGRQEADCPCLAPPPAGAATN